MIKIKYILIVVIITALTGCSYLQSMREKGANCYWMENYSGKFEWVSTKEALNLEMDKQTCYESDSCDGGRGFSNGGCYKWSKGANGKRLPWDNVDKGE